MLNQAQTWLGVEAQHAARLDGLVRQDAIRQLFIYAQTLEGFALAEFKTMVEELDIKGRAFTDLLKAAEPQPVEGDGKDADIPEALPILSPALGFQRDVRW